MGVSEILATIDLEIAKLQQARTLLSGGTEVALKRKPGRPMKAVSAAKKSAVSGAVKPAPKKKRNLSPEGRKRIAEAVKRRWDAQKKASAV
jgi:hypothetical protein